VSVAKKVRSETRQAKIFGLVLAAILVALGTLFWLRGHPFRAKALIPLALLPALLPFVAPGAWLSGFRLWMKLAEALSWVSTRVILGAFFYLILTPYGLLSRLFRKDPLDTAWKDGKPTYWRGKTPEECTLERYERMF
jgi:polyferredoxin